MKETSKKLATIAGRGRQNPKSLTEDEIVSVCSSLLVQFEKEPKLAPSLRKLIKDAKEFANAGDLTPDEVRAYQVTFSNDVAKVKGK